MKKVLLSALALLMMAGSGFAQNLPSYLPANGLVGWWPFNGNANDESGNGNNGTVNGATLTVDRFGNTGKAYGFDGIDDLISIQDQISLRPALISIAFWYKKENDILSQLIYKGNFSDASGEQYSINSQYGFAIKSGSNCVSGTGWHNLITLNNTPTSQWKFITGTFNGSELKLYENGLQLNSLLFNGNIDDCAGGSLTFGASWAQYPYYLNGSLDDIAIWNRALSQQEITAIYNASNCASDLSLTPASLQLNSGSTASFSASTTDPNPVYRWQSDLGLGFQDLSNVGQYSGAGSNNLQVAGLQLRNHQQKFRVISTSGNCVDTSALATISLSDTCINVVNDTNLITVTDTLIISITASPGLVQNTIKAYPNPTAGMLFINTGNFAAMPGYSIRIASVTGQEVYNALVNQALLQVPLASPSPEGLFFLRLYDASGALVTTRKIVLQ